MENTGLRQSQTISNLTKNKKSKFQNPNAKWLDLTPVYVRTRTGRFELCHLSF